MLRDIFSQHPSGEDVRKRYQECINLGTKSVCSPEKAENLLFQYISNLSQLLIDPTQMCDSGDYLKEYRSSISNLKNMKYQYVSAAEFQESESLEECSPIEQKIYDFLCDSSAPDLENPIRLLEEPLFQKFHDKSLVEYILWPISDLKTKGDLFLPYYQLKFYNVKFRFISNAQCIYSVS